MNVNLQSFAEGTAPAPGSPPDSGSSQFASTAPQTSLPDPVPLPVYSPATQVTPPGAGSWLFNSSVPTAMSMLDMGIADGPSGAADFINNGGNLGWPSNPMPAVDGFSANWLTEAINSGSSVDCLIDQGPDSSGWVYGRNSHSTVTAQILQNFLHLGNNG
jgi:hypothetical protein